MATYGFYPLKAQDDLKKNHIPSQNMEDPYISFHILIYLFQAKCYFQTLP